MGSGGPVSAGGGRYEIVPGDPRAHRDAVLGLSDRNLPASRETSERRYRKYYERSPLGPPSLFLARDRASQEICGMVAMFPTRLWVFGELVPAGINGDLAVDPEHRVLGPAMALERALLAALAADGRACAYGRPNPKAELIVERTGFADLGRVTRFVKVLDTRAVAHAYVERRALARTLSASSFALDPILSVLSRERFHKRGGGLSVERPDRFDDRFAGLWEAARRRQTVTSAREVDLLNWRYELDGEGGAPGYSIFALVGPQGEVEAYVVYRVRDGVRHVFDVVFGASRALDRLLAEFIRDARRARAVAISLIYAGAPGPLPRRLRAFGFLRRTEPDGLRVYVEPGTPQPERFLERANWYLLAGDTDV